MDKLTGNARDEALAPLLEAGWEMASDRDAISKDFVFKNFVEAFGWMTRITKSGRASPSSPRPSRSPSAPMTRAA